MWSLELLLHLKRNADRSWPRAALVESLRGSDLIVRQSLEGLVAAGLVSVDEDECVRYQPASPALAALADAAEARYARSPDAVRRTILSVPSGITAFADAFRVRKEPR